MNREPRRYEALSGSFIAGYKNDVVIPQRLGRILPILLTIIQLDGLFIASLSFFCYPIENIKYKNLQLKTWVIKIKSIFYGAE